MDLLQANGLVLWPVGPDGQRPGEEAARTVGAVGQAWELKLRRMRDWLRLPQCGRRDAREGKRGIGTGGTDRRDSGSGYWN
ncbi:MAG: hypothetical protein HXY20_10320 [Acidobacteria bacterium]|nr:hypothetical protein [Acidobacteriota bacterium]